MTAISTTTKRFALLLALMAAMLIAYAGAASAQSPTTLTSTVKQSDFRGSSPDPIPINGSPYDYSGRDYASWVSLDQVSITLTIFEGDTGLGDIDRDQLTLGLDGIDTGIKLNDFPDSQTTTQTITGVPNNAADILAALKADGQLNATVIDQDPGDNGMDLPATFDTTLKLVGTAESGTLDANTLPLECVARAPCSGPTVNSEFEVAQTFTAINSGNVTSAQVQVENWFGGSEDLVVRLATVDPSGAIGPIIPGASAIVPASEIPVNPNQPARLVTVSFDNPPEVQAGKKYALVLSSPSDSKGFIWVLDNPVTHTDDYPQGDLFTRNIDIAGGGWVNHQEYGDVVFAIYVEPSSDTSPPQLDLPGDMTVEATSASGAIVTFTATATDENPAHPTVSCSPASDSTFAIGTTPVNCSATDAANNTANGSFMVKVQDTTSPNITNVPSDITTEATSSAGATVTFTKPTATDIVDGALSSDKVSCDHQSGDTFPIGTTTVTCSATDSSGNEASASFTVTVIGATEQVTDLKDDIANLNLPAGTNTALQAKLNNALSAANGGDTASACTALNDFISQVRAQLGKKKISAQDAEELIAEAQRIRAVLGCS